MTLASGSNEPGIFDQARRIVPALAAEPSRLAAPLLGFDMCGETPGASPKLGANPFC